MSNLYRAMFVGAAMVGVTACHSWRTEEVIPSSSFEARRVRLQANGAPMQLEHVRLEGDSLRGIRRFSGQPAESVAVALGSLDSLEAWRTSTRKTIELVVGVTLPLVFVATRPCFIRDGCDETPPRPL